jgi:UDP:flavonoid glycosyltransferase YjiC (YdhE family)
LTWHADKLTATGRVVNYRSRPVYLHPITSRLFTSVPFIYIRAETLRGVQDAEVRDRRLDLQRVGAECDVAVLNGNLGTSSAMLLAGRPALHLPENLEHALNARAVARLGAGSVAPDKDAGAALGKLAALLEDGGDNAYAAAAQKVAARYSDFSASRQAERMVEALFGVVARAT